MKPMIRIHTFSFIQWILINSEITPLRSWSEWHWITFFSHLANFDKIFLAESLNISPPKKDNRIKAQDPGYIVHWQS